MLPAILLALTLLGAFALWAREAVRALRTLSERQASPSIREEDDETAVPPVLLAEQPTVGTREGREEGDESDARLLVADALLAVDVAQKLNLAVAGTVLQRVTRGNADPAALRRHLARRRGRRITPGVAPRWRRKIVFREAVFTIVREDGMSREACEIAVELGDRLSLERRLIQRSLIEAWYDRARWELGNPVSTRTARACWLLGVESDASRRQIKTRYWMLTRRFHPDGTPPDSVVRSVFTEVCQEINGAYEHLTEGQTDVAPADRTLSPRSDTSGQR